MNMIIDELFKGTKPKLNIFPSYRLFKGRKKSSMLSDTINMPLYERHQGNKERQRRLRRRNQG